MIVSKKKSRYGYIADLSVPVHLRIEPAENPILVPLTLPQKDTVLERFQALEQEKGGRLSEKEFFTFLSLECRSGEQQFQQKPFQELKGLCASFHEFCSYVLPRYLNGHFDLVRKMAEIWPDSPLVFRFGDAEWQDSTFRDGIHMETLCRTLAAARAVSEDTSPHLVLFDRVDRILAIELPVPGKSVDQKLENTILRLAAAEGFLITVHEEETRSWVQGICFQDGVAENMTEAEVREYMQELFHIRPLRQATQSVGWIPFPRCRSRILHDKNVQVINP